MPLDLVGASVVVVAHQFNPSVMSEVWLTRNGLLAPEDRRPGCVFADAFVNLRSRQFNVLLTPDQLQFSPDVAANEEQQLVLDKVGRIVELLPHIPYRAAGLNFVWSLDPDPETISTVTRRLFFIPDRPVFRHFDTEDAQFGSYLSKNILGCRLKLDIKPVTRTAIEPPGAELGPVVNLAFNFHLDVNTDENPPDRIRQLLGQWNEAKEVARRIAHDMENLR